MPKKREKNCEQSILQLKKHFTNVNIEHWETKKIQLTVKWAEHDLQRNDVVKNGFIRKIEEYNIKRNSDKVFAKQWQVALREYYIHLCKRTLVHDQINLKGARSTDSLNELFVQSQLTKCLDQYIVTMTETIRELQSRIVTGSVCLVSPYSGVDHLEPFTLHAVKRNLGCNGVSPQLETPEVEFTFDNNKSAEIVGQQLHKSDTQDNLYKKHYEKLYRFAFYQSQNTHFQKAGESKAIGLLADKLLCLCEGDMKKQLRIIDQFKIFQEIIDNFSSYKKYHKSYKAKTDRTAFFKKANSKPCKDDEDYDAVCYVAYKLQPLLKGDKKKQANIFYQFKFFQQMIENLQSFDKTKEIKFPNANSSTIDDIHSKQSKAERDEEEALCKVVVELGPKMQDDKIEQADIFYQFKYFQDCVAKNR